MRNRVVHTAQSNAGGFGTRNRHEFVAGVADELRGIGGSAYIDADAVDRHDSQRQLLARVGVPQVELVRRVRRRIDDPPQLPDGRADRDSRILLAVDCEKPPAATEVGAAASRQVDALATTQIRRALMPVAKPGAELRLDHAIAQDLRILENDMPNSGLAGAGSRAVGSRTKIVRNPSHGDDAAESGGDLVLGNSVHVWMKPEKPRRVAARHHDIVIEHIVRCCAVQIRAQGRYAVGGIEVVDEHVIAPSRVLGRCITGRDKHAVKMQIRRVQLQIGMRRIPGICGIGDSRKLVDQMDLQGVAAIDLQTRPAIFRSCVGGGAILSAARRAGTHLVHQARRGVRSELRNQRSLRHDQQIEDTVADGHHRRIMQFVRRDRGGSYRGLNRVSTGREQQHDGAHGSGDPFRLWNHPVHHSRLATAPIAPDGR